MQFEWDEHKSRSNLDKHGLDFETVMPVFHDPFVLSVPDLRYFEEARWFTLGRIEGVVIYIAHTIWEEDHEEYIRIISARAATPREERQYYAYQASSKTITVA